MEKETSIRPEGGNAVLCPASTRTTPPSTASSCHTWGAHSNHIIEISEQLPPPEKPSELVFGLLSDRENARDVSHVEMGRVAHG